jgi:glycosyltransferase involved in cell wall biosynthesis
VLEVPRDGKVAALNAAVEKARGEVLDLSDANSTWEPVALAFAKPIVMSAVGGFGEVAERGAGRLVAAGDREALAAALNELLADPDARERLSAAAREASAGPYSWDTVAKQTLVLYRELIG